MPSIRKTKSLTQSIRKAKKSLKREIAELCADFDYYDRTQPTTIGKVCLCGAIYQHIKLKEQELQQLKRKKR